MYCLGTKGSLRVGDTVLAGTAYGKVRAMTNERGEKVKLLVRLCR